MIDNNWIHDSNGSHQKSSILRIKVILTLSILLIGTILTVGLNGVGANSTQYQSEGIVIDFGEYNTVWSDADYNVLSDPIGLLDLACESHSYTHTLDADGKVVEIRGVSNTADKSWNLWYVPRGGLDFIKSESYSIDAKNYTVVAWAYCSSDGAPAVGVDASGTSIYGYSMARSTVTLSPAATEILGSLNAITTLVGTDYYSNYPKSVVDGKESNSIKVVGTYTDPSYESIMKLSPDLVICDGSQFNHIQMAKTLRNSQVGAVLLYDGESIQSILDNIFIVGIAMGYEERSIYVIDQLKNAIDTLSGLIAGHSKAKVMVSLSSSPSPYVAGNGTYAFDISNLMGGSNIYADKYGWAHINSEFIGKNSKYGDTYNPEVIIILTDNPIYTATKESYDSLINSLKSNWTSTTAYANGEIYLFCESLGEMAQRPGPRVAQLSELMARVLCPDSFSDGITLPKYIGDDYSAYLTYTKDLGFGD